MHRNTAIASVLATLAVSCIACAELVVDLGTVHQLSPRPTIQYNGGFSSAVSSRVDASGVRTITSFDLYDIVSRLSPDLALVEIRVYDAGGNSYGNWSPGADIDMFRITGGELAGNVTMGYSGAVTQHIGETSQILRNRTISCDAVSGDQHFNAEHFISLGAAGRAWMHFDGFLHSAGSSTGGGTDGSGSSGGSGGGFGGTWSGGGGSNEDPIYGGLLIAAGMQLEISEAGLGEGYGVALVFEPAAVPAPGAIALLAVAGIIARRRR
jgi:hypothetical protein